MRKNFKVLGITLLLISVFILGACSQSETFADQLNPIKIWIQNTNGVYQTLNVTDELTGVNYVVVSTRYSNAYEPQSISITPRLNADGSLYVTPVK